MHSSRGDQTITQNSSQTHTTQRFQHKFQCLWWPASCLCDLCVSVLLEITRVLETCKLLGNWGPERPWRSSTEHKTEELGIDSYPLETQTISSYRQSSWEPTKPGVSFLLLLILQLLLLILLLLLLHVDFPKQNPSIKLTHNWLFLQNQKKNQTNNKAKLQQQQIQTKFQTFGLPTWKDSIHLAHTTKTDKRASKQTNKQKSISQN